MIDEKKLIERLKRCGIEFLSHYYTNQEIIDIFCDLVNDEVEEQHEEHSKTDDWIPCSERLPEEPFGCIVTVIEGNPLTMQTSEAILPYQVGYSGGTWNDLDGEEIPFDIIAWMPAPKEPYKQNND